MNAMSGGVLLLGSEGMLGRAWRALLASRGIACSAPLQKELDFTDTAALVAAVDGPVTTVINCAAFTDVDGAESQHDQARLINGTAVGHLADRCAAKGVRLIHYSTDYVFDGKADQPYAVDHPASPVNAYGRSKWAGERLIREAGGPHLIVRTSWLYAPWAHNFVRSIAALAAQRDRIAVVEDQRGRPTSAEHLAATTLGLIQHGADGTFHVTDGGQCTWFEFAVGIVEGLGLDCRVEPCGSDRYPRPAERPAFSVLDLAKTEALVGVMPHWKENLASVLERLPENQP